MHLMKMISENNKEENIIKSGKAFEKEMMEAGAKLPDKKSEDKKPEDKKPEDKKPEDKKPEDKKPEDKKSEDKKPEDKKPEDKKPEDKKPEDKKPEDKKPEDKKSEDKKPEDKKPEDKKSEDKKSEDKDDDKKADGKDDEAKEPDTLKRITSETADAEPEKKRKIPLPVKILLIAAGVCGVVYLATALFFMSHFSFNIYINGLDMSLMGIEKANECLRAKKGSDYEFVITESGNEISVLTDKDLNSKYDYTEELKKIKAEEEPFIWPPYLTYTRKYEIEPDLTFDDARAREKLLTMDPVKYTQNEHKSSVKIMKSQANGYILINTDEKQPDQNKLIKLIISDMHEAEPSMDISDTDYDVDIPYTEKQKSAIELFEKINAIQDTKILFKDYGQEMLVSKEDLASFLKTDAEGRFIVDVEGYPTLDKDKIAEYSEKVGEAFTSKDKKMWWHKYNGGTVSVNSGTYGKTVDTEAVSGRLERLLEKAEDYTGPPDYIVEEDKDPNAPDEIGDTYIEVDMTRQKLYYLKDGKLFMTSDVVTGNSGRHHDTTQLMAYIYYMQRDRVLVGEDYRTPVKYWMAFHNHEGLHDASWRRSFGGDIYKYNGSHGCVNLPTSFAAELYDNVYVGLPVITYY